MGSEVAMLVTDELIESGKSRAGGWSKEQLALLGVAWPPPKGWKDTVIGTRIETNKAQLFTELRK